MANIQNNENTFSFLLQMAAASKTKVLCDEVRQIVKHIFVVT